MKTHKSSFKEQIKLIGKEIDSRITFGSTVLGKNDLNAVTPSYQGAILKSVMKQLDIDSNVEIPIGTILKYEFGLKVNGEYEYINYGNYVVYSVEKQEDTKSYKITCYDKLLYSMLDYAKLPITYPISIRDYINAISTVLGLKFANKSETFANYNKQIQADLYDGLGYTFRDILDELAQVTASTICLNNNDELEIRYITETGDTIDEEYLKDVNVNFGEKFGAVNTIVLSRSGDSDSVYYPSVLPANPYEIKISDNQIMNGNDRADFLPDIYNKLNGLEFYTNDFVSTGICYYDLCDRYSVKVGENTYSCVMFNDEVLVTQGLEENIYTELPEQTETDYKHASKDDRMINQVYIIAKKNEAEILAVVNTTEQLQKEINPIKNESGSEITIEDASNNPLTYLEIEGKSTQTTRSGKNLFKENFRQGNMLGQATDSRIFSDDNYYIEAGKTYTFSTNATEKDVKYGINIANVKFPTGEVNRVYDSGWVSSSTFTFTANVSGYFGVVLARINHTTDTLLLDDIKDNWFMLEKGSTATEYEAYGVSPSPDFPSEIESVGYENLFDYKLMGTDKAVDYTYYKNLGMNTFFAIPIYVGKNVTVIASSNVPVASPSDIYLINNLNESTTDNINVNTPRTITSNSDGYVYLAYITDRTYYNEIKNGTYWVMINEGTEAKEFIPYGKYGIEVETVGKNKFDVNKTSYVLTYNKYAPVLTITDPSTFIMQNTRTDDWNGIYVTGLDKSKTYTISFDITLTSSGNEKNIIVHKSSNGGNLTGLTLNTTKHINYTFTDSDSVYIKQAPLVVSKYSNVQLEVNDLETSYKPYQGNTSLIVLDQPLRSLPNGVKDIAYIKNNKLYVDRYVGSVVLNGNEDWIYENSVSSPTERTVVRKYFASTNNNAWLSNRFIMDTEETPFDGNILTIRSDVIYLSMKDEITGILSTDDNATRVSKIKTYLSTHNAEVDYELATPVTEELGEIEMLKTLKGYNNILTTDDLSPIINLTYVRDTIIADYVENHVTELKLTENEIKASVESVSSSVDGLNTTINRVEEITNDNSQVINIISTNIDRTTGEVREVTTTNGFKFDSKGLNIYTDENSYNTQIDNVGTYYKDGNEVISQTTKDGSLLKNLKMQGQTQYSFDGDSYDFIEERVEIDGEYCYATFYNGEE